MTERFLRLVSNMLKAGYLDDWKFNQTISGTPQGGVIQSFAGKHLFEMNLTSGLERVLIPQITQKRE